MERAENDPLTRAVVEVRWRLVGASLAAETKHDSSEA